MESQVHFSSNSNLSNEICVRAKLTPGINPSEWADTCQVLATMDSGFFSCVRERIHAISKSYQQGLQEAPCQPNPEP